MQRRAFVAGTAAFVGWPAMAAFAPPGKSLLFAVRREGRPIGWHEVRVLEEGPRLVLAIDITLDVRWGPLTLYRYRHSNREEWRDGAFHGFASRTDDDGTLHEVQAWREGGDILVESGRGRSRAPSHALPSTYWCSRFVEIDRWIDTQSGSVLAGHASRMGRETLAAAGGRIEAERWRVEGDVALDLWYRKGSWVGLAFEGPDGSSLDYELQESGAGRA
ncbi:DUF6134 family protein [Marinimicrococcus flavescens]|uniref:DUF6134 family protein n=1 Tax=Marinimicrococcus flavescens TaxID=3031815 RepID=A0AAP3V1K1_9PROT|nr:DUF6134 family protein [Marinimicrococcus flavescens]